MDNLEKLYEYNAEKPDLSVLYLESKGIDYENALMHHGRLGQKKGVRNGPPYPLDRKKAASKYGGKLFPSNKDEAPSQKAKGLSGLVEKHKAKKAYKKKVESANRARQAKAAKAEQARKAQEEQDRREKEAIEREEWRQNVIKTGDIQSAKNNTDLFSNDEINQIITRYQTNQKLSNLVADANPQKPPENLPEKQISKWEKMGNKIDEINKFAGPLSKLASNASTMYDLASKVAKDKQAKDNEQYKRQKEAEETAYKRKKEAEETKYRREQDALDRKERYDLHMTKEEQNKAKQQQNNQQNNNNQPKQQQPQNNQPKQDKKKEQSKKEEPKKNTAAQTELSSDQKKAINLLNNKALDAEAMGKTKQAETYNKELVAIAKGEKSASPYLKEASKPYKIDFNTEGWSKKTTIRTEKAAQRVEKSAKNAKESAKKSIVNIASNPNTQGALAQLTRDLTKNTKTTSGQQVRIHNNADWLANQSTEVLKLMKKNIDRGKNNPSAMVTLQDINSILKKRGARSPLQ